jgi:hypothetical protein
MVAQIFRANGRSRRHARQVDAHVVIAKHGGRGFWHIYGFTKIPSTKY